MNVWTANAHREGGRWSVTLRDHIGRGQRILLDLNGPTGLTDRGIALALADELNIELAHTANPPVALTRASKGRVLRAYHDGRVIWDANGRIGYSPVVVSDQARQPVFANAYVEGDDE